MKQKSIIIIFSIFIFLALFSLFTLQYQNNRNIKQEKVEFWCDYYYGLNSTNISSPYEFALLYTDIRSSTYEFTKEQYNQIKELLNRIEDKLESFGYEVNAIN